MSFKEEIDHIFRTFDIWLGRLIFLAMFIGFFLEWRAGNELNRLISAVGLGILLVLRGWRAQDARNIGNVRNCWSGKKND